MVLMVLGIAVGFIVVAIIWDLISDFFKGEK